MNAANTDIEQTAAGVTMLSPVYPESTLVDAELIVTALLPLNSFT